MVDGAAGRFGVRCGVVEVDVVLLRAERPRPEADPSSGERIHRVDLRGRDVAGEVNAERIALRLVLEVGKDHELPFKPLGLVVGQDGDRVRGAARRPACLLRPEPRAQVGRGRRRAFAVAFVLIGGDELPKLLEVQ
jgi:hypothetical protein